MGQRCPWEGRTTLAPPELLDRSQPQLATLPGTPPIPCGFPPLPLAYTGSSAAAAYCFLLSCGGWGVCGNEQPAFLLHNVQARE